LDDGIDDTFVWALFGMQPVGIYPIHIIVKNGRAMLLGVVDTAADRQIAEVRAREVTGVFGSFSDQRSAKSLTIKPSAISPS
jgi:hypothetical protein